MVFIAHGDRRRKTGYRYKRLTENIAPRYSEAMKMRLKELRTAAGLTQTQVAEKAGMSQSYYTEIELGRKQINARRMEALARVFGVKPYELIESSQSPAFKELVELAEGMSERQRHVLMDVARSLAKSDEPTA